MERRSGASSSDRGSRGGLVPAGDDTLLALVAEDAYRRRAQGEEASVVGREREPTRGEYAKDVAVGEQGDIPIRLDRPLDHARRASVDLLHRLAMQRPIAPELPPGALLADLRRGEALVVSVIPLDEIVVDLSHIAVAGQAAGFAGALQWTRKH
jgi:hypothetical protein